MFPAALSLPAKLLPSPSPSALPPHPSRQNLPAETLPPPHAPLKRRLLRLADTGRLSDALSALDLLGGAADLVAYSALLHACARRRDLAVGRRVHRRLLASGLAPDAVAANSLLSLYSKCGDWDVALSLFDEMGSRRDLVSWTTMITSAAQNRMERTAIELFCEMLESGFTPNEYTFCGLIQACSNEEYVFVGRLVLGFVIKMGFFGTDVSVGCALIDMFAKTHDLFSARKVFDGLCERNAVVWTLMITRYGQNGCCEEAIRLFLDMIFDRFEPDQFTVSSVISACTELESLSLGEQLHSLAIRTGLASDTCVGCSLVDMYAKCSVGGSMNDSRRVFHGMPEHNVMSWTAVISGYVQCGGQEIEAIKLFSEMVDGRVRPNQFTYSSILKACANLCDHYLGEQIHAHVTKLGLASVNFVGNSLVSLYSQSGRIEDARKAFDLLFEKNMISYNTIIDGMVKNSSSDEAYEFLSNIQSMDIGLSSFTFASLLSAAASVGLLSKGKQLHAQLLKAGFRSNRGICNSLISMYSRCGNLDDACQVFDEMDEPNVITWTSMITGFAKHGYADQAVKLFHDMVSSGGKPNEVTFIAVLSACSHVGRINEGWEYFNSMERNHGVVPKMEHYACMADLLGRAGHLEEAIEFINSMPLKADALVWRTLLAASRVHGNIKVGEIAAKNILKLEPQDPAAYVLLSNLYAKAGKWKDVAELRSGMKDKNLSKEAGLSWVEINNKIHQFHAGDTSHPQAREIYEELDELLCKIKVMGYAPDTNYVLHDVEDELKEHYLSQHSEKIAVAFGIISTSAAQPIRIFKNLRFCGDCHNAIKYISKATGREIIVRDTNRFHRIRNGECSCGDYW
ncbi:Pentatricopeptide repeat-containing protein, chloroplastic [Ananas comosus]|uniref:Pentatricopeptide repeat-containing protein, chloroplastic n=1 Tax=Ananas comosus TaxID=4615 RepID=A0A199W257_ANACO|nr:Pentatricopeptide repeat-containing protein, chloroplastic [Ananas comosus]